MVEAGELSIEGRITNTKEMERDLNSVKNKMDEVGQQGQKMRQQAGGGQAGGGQGGGGMLMGGMGKAGIIGAIASAIGMAGVSQANKAVESAVQSPAGAGFRAQRDMMKLQRSMILGQQAQQAGVFEQKLRQERAKTEFARGDTGQALMESASVVERGKAVGLESGNTEANKSLGVGGIFKDLIAGDLDFTKKEQEFNSPDGVGAGQDIHMFNTI